MACNCNKKDCDIFNTEKNECGSAGSWNGCQDWMGFDYWNYTKNNEFVNKYG